MIDGTKNTVRTYFLMHIQFYEKLSATITTVEDHWPEYSQENVLRSSNLVLKAIKKIKYYILRCAKYSILLFSELLPDVRRRDHVFFVWNLWRTKLSHNSTINTYYNIAFVNSERWLAKSCVDITRNCVKTLRPAGVVFPHNFSFFQFPLVLI